MIPTVRALAIRSLPDAERELAAVGINPSENVALKTMMVHHSLLVEKISCQEGLFIKQEMISLGGDAACPCGEDHSPVSGVISWAPSISCGPSAVSFPPSK